ncbi:carbon-nitrogen hydrolase [Suillus fuscotomentosus]|uniref:Carbon-nitrogen hydrolase n=1 Tax=Suillus fuscotomentosus TaxID=1912939 RepID=A0AAD4HN76_9AGAM|nr:carbon-nitrogen hydrolase [Suillus fuscotomentosus]KAG1901439.1 carbon-nitrogen hydrolase [Suillus fuscotomentosus]
MSSQLRVAVVQFAPKLGQVQANIAKARELCNGLKPRSVDLLCFPEMFFSGYVFPDTATITPYLEHPHTGPTATFCAELARSLECFVAAGYPEKLEPHEHAPPLGGNSLSFHQPRIGANSAFIIGAYRKTNLYKLDLPWAVPGSGFTTMTLPHPLGPTTLAICNDLNVQDPAVWESLEEGPYELAQHCIRSGTRLLILLNAWLHPDEDGEVSDSDSADCTTSEQNEDTDGTEPSWEVINYWAMRLNPLWATIREATHENEKKPGIPNELLVLVCNRFGNEGGSVFAGSSALMSLRRGSGRPRLLQMMGQREEGIGFWTANIPGR